MVSSFTLPCIDWIGLMVYLQLRNLVWATSKHDVYLMSGFSLLHWNAVTSEKHEVLNFLRLVAPTEVSTQSFDPCDFQDK